MAKIYWDSNLFIYLFEEHAVFAGAVKTLRMRMLERGDRLFTSTLAVGEILVKPLSEQRRDIADRYLTFFQGPAVTVLPFDFDASRRYPEIRIDRSIRPPDAIHLACAAAAGIDLFITNDDRLIRKTIPGVDFLCGLERIPL